MSKIGERGKSAEAKVRAWLDAESNRDVHFAYHRFPDARAARGALTAQPSDFLVGRQGRMVFLEVKETKEKRRLPKASVGQYGTLLKWSLAGFETLVVIHRTELGDWTFLDNLDLFCHDVCPPSFSFMEGRSFPNEQSMLEILL